MDALIRQNDLQDKVRLTGMIPRDVLPSYYRAADVFVLPTLSIEGFGLVTIEALATGLPVLGTPVGGTVEILKGVDESLLFPVSREKMRSRPRPPEAGLYFAGHQVHGGQLFSVQPKHFIFE